METKKRFRPTLTAYRKLENEVIELERELENVRKANNEAERLNVRLCAQLKEIKSRGFWARVFNK